MSLKEGGFQRKMSLKEKNRNLGIANQHAGSGKLSLEQIEAFLAGSEEVQFEGGIRRAFTSG